MTDRNSKHEDVMATTTWPQLAEGLYSFLTGRGAMIEYEFDDLEVRVPRDTGSDAPQARWSIRGTVRVRTTESSGR